MQCRAAAVRIFRMAVFWPALSLCGSAVPPFVSLLSFPVPGGIHIVRPVPVFQATPELPNIRVCAASEAAGGIFLRFYFKI